VWSVKLGIEARPEVVVSRVLWAAGYHQHPMYYLPRWTLVGGDSPGRQPAARFRLKPAGQDKTGEWSFYDNPFVDTKPYKGLLLVLLLLTSFDLRDSNNAVYEVGGGERWYVVKDVGGALGGRRGGPLGFLRSGTKSDIDRFESMEFVKGYDGTRARLAYIGPYYRNLYDRHDAADVQWTCDRLDRLTPSQWSEAFRAAGYDPLVAGRYITRIRRKLYDARQATLAAMREIETRETRER